MQQLLTPAGFRSTSSQVHLAKFDALVSQDKGPDLIGVCHAPRLQDKQAAMARSIILDVAQAQPGIDQGGNADHGLVGRFTFGSVSGE